MEIVDQIKRIKYLRIKPEERFLIDILNKVKKGFSDEYPQSTYYSLNGKILFEQDGKNDVFWVRYDDVWSVLINKYRLKHHIIRDIIKVHVRNALKLKVNTTNISSQWYESVCVEYP